MLRESVKERKPNRHLNKQKYNALLGRLLFVEGHEINKEVKATSPNKQSNKKQKQKKFIVQCFQDFPYFLQNMI